MVLQSKEFPQCECHIYTHQNKYSRCPNYGVYAVIDLYSDDIRYMCGSHVRMNNLYDPDYWGWYTIVRLRKEWIKR